MKGQQWKTMVVEGIGGEGGRNNVVWKAIYREGGTKKLFSTINAVQKRGKNRFFDLTTVQNI